MVIIVRHAVRSNFEVRLVGPLYSPPGFLYIVFTYDVNPSTRFT